MTMINEDTDDPHSQMARWLLLEIIVEEGFPETYPQS